MTEVVEVVGQFISASNATLLGRDESGELVVYKPHAGEAPLWDFPDNTLAQREVLTYEIAVALGFDVVPETVLGEGPYGMGAIQRFVEIDESFDPLPLVKAGSHELWPMAVLDVVCNNADRKLGHMIREQKTHRLYGIDHGLNFHVDHKLRTVLWCFAGESIPSPLLDQVRKLNDALHGSLQSRVLELVSSEEFSALRDRVAGLLETPVHPHPPTTRPAIPWPPY
ncbi:MAG: SCO1664 family protein [Acidimicrobiia bacterium]|nr:SCO1664 family protein [Acidimicrobiia bacterium]